MVEMHVSWEQMLRGCETSVCGSGSASSVASLWQLLPHHTFTFPSYSILSYCYIVTSLVSSVCVYYTSAFVFLFSFPGVSTTITSGWFLRELLWGTRCCRPCESHHTTMAVELTTSCNSNKLIIKMTRSTTEPVNITKSSPWNSPLSHFYENPIQFVGRSAFQFLPQLHTLWV